MMVLLASMTAKVVDSKVLDPSVKSQCFSPRSSFSF